MVYVTHGKVLGGHRRNCRSKVIQNGVFAVSRLAIAIAMEYGSLAALFILTTTAAAAVDYLQTVF